MDGAHGHRIWSYRQKYRTIDGLRENTINAALRRMGYSTKENITGHGFRATACTILDERLGFDRAAIEAQLAHSVKDLPPAEFERRHFLRLQGV